MTITLGEFASFQKDWSEATFGPAEHRGPIGPLMHLELEVQEVLKEIKNGGDREKIIEELADCLFLLVDGTWRAGFWTTDLLHAAMEKLHKNQERQWPDWRTADANAPIEHVRS